MYSHVRSQPMTDQEDDTHDRPPFCGFAIPERMSPHKHRCFSISSADSEEEQYAKIEELWDALWTGTALLLVVGTTDVLLVSRDCGEKNRGCG